LIQGIRKAQGKTTQVWNAIVNLLDEVVQVLGDKEISSKEFQEIIEAGLESLTLGLIPPALDQVIVGSTDRSRHPPLRAAFLMGATYDSVPETGAGGHHSDG